MCKSSSQTTHQGPPSWLENMYKSFLGNAQGLANSGDPNSLVAGFTPDQMAAFRQIGKAGKMQPEQFSADAINKYMDPYLSNVVDTTQQQLRLQNNQQQNDLKGNLASSGAWGGDRSAVLQSQLAGQQDTANNATIANLYSQGYGQALGEFNNQQQMSLAEQQAALQSAQARLGAGTLQQQLAQQKIDVPYQQMNWLAQLFGTLGPLSGGWSQTSQQQPFTIADGGRTPRFDDGGSVKRDIYMPFGGGPQLHGGSLNVNPPAMSNGQNSGGILGQLGGVNSSLKSLGEAGGISGGLSSLGDAAMLALAFLKNGGRAQKFDDGGVVDENGNFIPTGAIALSEDKTPAAWKPAVTNYAPAADVSIADAQINPAWENGAPVIQSDKRGLSDAEQPSEGSQGLKPGYYGKREAPSPWMALATGVLGALSSRSLSKGALAGLQEYQKEQDLEENPTVDHSGMTVHIRYGGPHGQDFDTGIPTSAAIQAKALGDYRKGELETRQDAIVERAQAAKDSVEQRREAAIQAAQDRAAALQVARINASAGRYTPIPGKGVDENGHPVDGVYMTNGKTGEMEFRPGIVLTNKAQTNFRSLPAMVAAKFQQEHPDATVEDAENFAADYTKRNAATKAFGSGPQGNSIRSFNVALAHLDTLGNLVDALHNGDAHVLNWVNQKYQQQFGGTAPTNFDAAKAIVGDEIVKSIVGSGGGVADREKAQNDLNKANSPQQLKSVIDTYKHLMVGQLGGLRQQYETSTNRHDFDTMLSPEALATYKKLHPQGGGAHGPAVGTVQKGFRFKGGNPADPHNWERVH